MISTISRHKSNNHYHQLNHSRKRSKYFSLSRSYFNHHQINNDSSTRNRTHHKHSSTWMFRQKRFYAFPPTHGVRPDLNVAPTPTKDLIKNFSRFLWPRDWKLRRNIVLAASFLVLSKVLNVQVPYLFKEIVDLLGSDMTLATGVPVALLLGYGAARSGQAIFQFLKNALFSYVGQSATLAIASQVYRHLLDMDLKFHMERQTGGMSRAIDRGTKGINTVLNALLFNIVPTIIEISLVCGILTYTFGKEYAFITMAALAVYGVFTFTITQWRTKQRMRMNQLDNKAGSISVDTLMNYETVKFFNNEELERKRYHGVMKEFNREVIKVQTSLAILNIGQNVIFTVAIVAVMYMASKGIVAGDLKVGDLVMVNGLLFQLSMPLNFLGSVYRELRQASIDMDVLFSLKNTKSKIEENENSPDLDFKEGKIEFKNVKFGYEDKAILQGASFTVPAGTKVAIVGSSGGGKSTLLKLLFRFYDPNDGAIMIDGQNIKDVKLSSMRKHIGVVSQDTVLFNETIEYNLRYGNPNATKEQIIEAAKKSYIHDAIMSMPKGYDTPVGERGLKLSGGEKQRICIARALLKEPKVLLLDEITSSLDAESEYLIQKALNELSRERTVLIVSHRLKTIQTADKIVVLDNGIVAEEGTHEELISKKGLYYNLVQKQSTLA